MQGIPGIGVSGARPPQAWSPGWELGASIYGVPRARWRLGGGVARSLLRLAGPLGAAQNKW